RAHRPRLRRGRKRVLQPARSAARGERRDRAVRHPPVPGALLPERRTGRLARAGTICRPMTARRGEWLHLEQVMQEIVSDLSEGEPAVAFAFSGGGASGAYEAGGLDAWLRLASGSFPQYRFLRPRIILGSSPG